MRSMVSLPGKTQASGSASPVAKKRATSPTMMAVLRSSCSWFMTVFITPQTRQGFDSALGQQAEQSLLHIDAGHLRIISGPDPEQLIHVRTKTAVGEMRFQNPHKLAPGGDASFLPQVMLERLDHRSRVHRRIGQGQRPILIKQIAPPLPLEQGPHLGAQHLVNVVAIARHRRRSCSTWRWLGHGTAA
jgi:hypothetical protein